MTSLRDHHSNDFVKLLLIGDAKSGKTGSLISLVKAGYKLRILDFDNLLDILKYLVRKDCPEMLDNIEYRTIRDEYHNGALKGVPKAFSTAAKMLSNWGYTDDSGTEIDLGDPAQWGPDCILVIDSMSRLCDAAYDWRLSIAPRGRSGEIDGRAVYGDAQDAAEAVIADLTSKTYATNVIVIAHLQYLTLPDGTMKGFPQGVGQKLSPKIPQYFSSVVHYINHGGKRTMRTTSSAMIDLANPAPFAMATEYPVETGLAEFFKVLRGLPNQPQEAVTETATPAAILHIRKPIRKI